MNFATDNVIVRRNLENLADLRILPHAKLTSCCTQLSLAGQLLITPRRCSHTMDLSIILVILLILNFQQSNANQIHITNVSMRSKSERDQKYQALHRTIYFV